MTRPRSNPWGGLKNVPKTSPFSRRLKDTAELLTGEREEHFEFERAIRLLEFQTWIYWPLTYRSERAALMAAVLFLDRIEEDIFDEESDAAHREVDPDLVLPGPNLSKPLATLNRINALRADKTYRQVHDYIFATRGGLTRLLGCPSPKGFNAPLLERIEKAQHVVDLIDYRLRHAQHGGASGHGTNRHAVFFKWRPTRHVQGKRGVTVDNKSADPKTLFRWQKAFSPSAIFIYLNQKLQYSQFPQLQLEFADFLMPLLDEAKDIDELRRFFGTYAYISETIQAAGGEKPVVIVPATVPRVEVSTAPFTQTELQTIAAYGDEYLAMGG